MRKKNAGIIKQGKQIMETKKLYRAEPIFQENPLGFITKIKILEFKILKETPSGYWIQKPFEAKETFVLDGDGKRFAYRSKVCAIKSLRRRRKMQIQILKSQLRRAEAVCGLFENGATPEDVLQNKVVISKMFN